MVALWKDITLETNLSFLSSHLYTLSLEREIIVELMIVSQNNF